MRDRGRTVLFVVPALGLAALLVWSFTGLPDFGHYRGPYGDIVSSKSVTDRHATNAVAAVTFDFRGFDTLGEEFILFAAVMGVSALLRTQRQESERPSPLESALARAEADTSDAVRIVCMGTVAPAVLLGLYVVAHGHLTPGGGFQGGVVLASAPLLVYLAGRFITFRQVSPKHLLDAGEGVGAAAFVGVGLAAMLAGAAFLTNVLPLGSTGSVFSAGTIPVLNVAVGLEVAGGLLLIMWEFAEQTVMVRAG